jgi:hypothetical protein
MAAAHPALAELQNRAVRSLIAAHVARADEPLVLALRYKTEEPQDVFVVEVLENFPGDEADPPFMTEFEPSADLLLVGKLHLALTSPAQFRAAIRRHDPLIVNLRASAWDGVYVAPDGPRRELANELLAQLRAA